MTKSTILRIFLATVFSFPIGPAMAKAPDLPPPVASCTVIEDAIIPLKPPVFGGPVEWRRVIGQEGLDRMSDVMALADGGVIAVGESTSFSRDAGSKPPRLYAIRVDKQGKALYDKRIDIKNFSNVAAAVILKDQIVVVSQLREKNKPASVQIDFMDGSAVIKSTRVMTDAKKDMIAADLIANTDGSTLTLAVMLVGRTDKNDSTTVFYRLDSTGKVLSRRDYLPGVSTRISQLQRFPGGEVVGVGRIGMGDDRQAGWILQVSRQGDLLAQRPYARGTQAQLNKAIDDGLGGMYVVGEAIPAGGGYRAAWLMHLDGGGRPLWQRFVSGKYRYNAIDMTVEKDGRLQVLMAGRPVEDGGREHARIITLSSIGDIIQDDSYLEGTNALPVKLLRHSVTGKRFLAGMAQTGFAQDGATEPQRLVTYDAWLTGLPALEPYRDPCKPAHAESLDD